MDLFSEHRIFALAPAGGFNTEDLDFLKSLAFLKIRDDFFDTSTSFHSGSDDKRFSILKHAIYDSSCDFIWCLRGGYGSAKLIDKFLGLAKPKKQKTLIGYSDITALHLFFSQEWGWKTIHGPVLFEILKGACRKKISDLINNLSSQIIIDELIPYNEEAQNVQSLQSVVGKLTGGNLTLIQTSIGTSWEVETTNKILFLEDVSVKPYQIDRTLLHLKQANILKKVRAIVFGTFNFDEVETTEALKNFAKILDIPVFKTDKIGHGQLNYPLIYNNDAKISFEKKFILAQNFE